MSDVKRWGIARADRVAKTQALRYQIIESASGTHVLLTNEDYDALAQEVEGLRERLEESERGWDELASLFVVRTTFEMGEHITHDDAIELYDDERPNAFAQIAKAKQRAEEGKNG